MRKFDDQQIADLLRPVMAGWGKATLKGMGESSFQLDIAKKEIIRALRTGSIEMIRYGSNVGIGRSGEHDPNYRQALARLGKRAAEREAAERAVIEALCTLEEIDAAIAGFIRR